MDTMWMVRAGEGAYLAQDFLKNNVVAIGWNSVGDLNKIKDLQTLKEKLRNVYPDSSSAQISNFAGQLFRFKSEFKPGQKVITYSPNERLYHVGEIDSDYKYSKDLLEYHHYRKIKWQNTVSRDSLSAETRNSLGAIATIFRIPDEAAKEILRIRTEAPVTYPTEKLEETLDTIKEDIEAKANEFIKDAIMKLNWDDFQDYVAGILRGMGYKTLVSVRGADRGKDIIASPDGLGLENPKIVVECKHRNKAIDAPEIRSFIGGLRDTDRGLYVSTGGFTKEAKYEADRAKVPVSLVDSEMLVLLTVQHYDKFDSDTRALVSLKKIYWPI
ncbi:MAG: restriction endonuclease [Bdellovibrionota bacterium]